MLTRRQSSALLREAVDEQQANEVLTAYMYSKIHRGNTRTALYSKLERVQAVVPQSEFGTPFYAAYRRINHTLNGARMSWGGKSVVDPQLADFRIPTTPIGIIAWEKAVGGPKKFNKLLRQAREEAAEDDTDDDDDDYEHTQSRGSSVWQPQPQPVMHMAPSRGRTHSRTHQLAQRAY